MASTCMISSTTTIIVEGLQAARAGLPIFGESKFAPTIPFTVVPEEVYFADHGANGNSATALEVIKEFDCVLE